METLEESTELEFKTLDVISLHHQIDNFFALEYSDDGYFYITTNAGIYVLQLRGYMNNFQKLASLTKLFFKPSSYTVGDKLEIDINEFIDMLPQFDLYEAVLRSDVSPNLKCADKPQPQPTVTKCSPVGLISKAHCAFAVLNNYGSLEVYMQLVKINFTEEFIVLHNISEDLINHFKTSWKNIKSSDPLIKYQELKRRVDMVIATALTWSHVIINENTTFCILIVGHPQGKLTLWRIDARRTNEVFHAPFKTPLLTEFSTSLSTITTLHWVQAENDGLLLAADNVGKISAFCVYSITSYSISLSEETVIWDKADFIKVDFFKVYKTEDKLFLFIVKRVHLIIVVLNQEGQIIDNTAINADNFQITALEHYENNSYFLLTYSGALFELKIAFKEDKIKVLRRYIHLKINWLIKRAVGLYISPNKVFMGILTPLYKLRNIRRNKEQIKFVIMKNLSKDPLTILMNNQEGTIKHFWDCFETLRLYGIVERNLPCHGLPETVDYDSFSFAKLKTYLWLAKSSEMLIDRVYFLKEYNIKSCRDIKLMLEIKLTIKHMEDLLSLYQKNKTLSTFQFQSLYLHNIYLKEIVLDDVIKNLGLGKNTINSVIEVLRLSNRIKYPEVPTCFICEEKITTSHCQEPHVDNRCAISNVQILWPPYYKCSYCKCNVHEEIEKEYYPVACPYCDVNMEYINDLLPITDTDSNETKTININKVINSCKEDCDKSEISDIQIEGSAFEGINVKMEFLNIQEKDDSPRNNMEVTEGESNGFCKNEDSIKDNADNTSSQSEDDIPHKKTKHVE